MSQLALLGGPAAVTDPPRERWVQVNDEVKAAVNALLDQGVISIGGPTGIMGTVGLLTLASVFAFLAGLNYFNRDGNVPAMEQGVQHTSAAAQRPVGSSMWPLIGAVGVAGLFAETHPDPSKALSDGPNAWPLDKMEALLETLLALDSITKKNGFLESTV